MPNRETWEFINSFAPWFSGLGTLCAVLVSLYLALRTSRPRVLVSSSIARVIPTGRRLKDGAEFFKIHVVNHGFRDVVVSGIMWEAKSLAKTIVRCCSARRPSLDKGASKTAAW